MEANNEGITVDGLDIYFNGRHIARLSASGIEEEAAKAISNGARALSMLDEMIGEGFMPEGSDFEREAYELLGRDTSELKAEVWAMSNESKHTPGPWKWETFGLRSDAPGFKNDFIIWPSNVPGGLEDDAPRSQQLGACGLHSETNAEANARLIAAAPELLEALKAALPYMWGDNARHELRDEMEAAIAKAEGRA